MTGSTKRGFTLVEVLVSTAVISIVMVLVLNLIVIYFRAQSRVYADLYVESTARQIFSGIGERTLEGFIDYDYYLNGNPSNMPEALALRSVDGRQTVYWFWDDFSGDQQLYVCPDMPQDSSCPIGATVNPITHPDWYKVNPDNVKFSGGEFRVYPDDAPYMVAGAPLSDDSPFVTVVMAIEPDEGESSPLLQTAFSTRVYVR